MTPSFLILQRFASLTSLIRKIPCKKTKQQDKKTKPDTSGKKGDVMVLNHNVKTL
jgi:hypothetical protein